jgi:exonuclease III
MHSLIDSGKREELEIWAEEHKIDISLIQETWIYQCAVERRAKYTIFFSSDDNNLNNRTEAGVAIMIKNKHLNKIIDIEPISDRLMSISLRGTVTYTFVNTYMHTSAHPDKNPALYKLVSSTVNKYKAGGPVFIGGDFNADIQSTDISINKIVGPRTFDKEHEHTLTDEGMISNKDELIDFCTKNKYTIANTWFEKTRRT